MASQRPAKKALVHRVHAARTPRAGSGCAGAEAVVEVQLVRGALGHADRRAIQIAAPLHVGIAAHREALAVVEVHRPLVQPERGVAQEGLGASCGTARRSRRSAAR